MTYLINKTKLMKRLFSLEKINSGKSNYFWSMVSMAILSNILFTIATSSMLNTFFGFTSQNSLNNYDQDLRGVLLFIFGLLIFAPVLEELVTRLLLTDIVWNQFIGINLIFLMFQNILLSFSILLFTIIRMFFVKPFYKLSYWPIFATSAIFAFMHVSIFRNLMILESVDSVLIKLILLLPFFVLGILLALTRIRLDIRYSMLMHSISNLPAALIVIIKYFGNNITGLSEILISIGFFGLTLFLPVLFILSPWFGKYHSSINKCIKLLS